MDDQVMDLVEKIAQVRGQDYVDGLVDMANILARKSHESKERPNQKS